LKNIDKKWGTILWIYNYFAKNISFWAQI
jgi:hypothetical protein